MRSFIAAGALALGFFTIAAPADANVTMVLRQEVADYSTWRKMYDGMQGTQRPMEVVKSTVYRSVENPNEVTLVRDFVTGDAAKAYFASYTIRNAIQGGGSKGSPKVWFTTQAPGASGHDDKVRLFVHHAVADYAAWRKSYDGFVPKMRQLGVSGQGVLTMEESQNDVIVYHDFASDAKAKAFLASPALKSAMQGAGVKGEPQSWITTPATK